MYICNIYNTLSTCDLRRNDMSRLIEILPIGSTLLTVIYSILEATFFRRIKIELSFITLITRSKKKFNIKWKQSNRKNYLWNGERNRYLWRLIYFKTGGGKQGGDSASLGNFELLLMIKGLSEILLIFLVSLKKKKYLIQNRVDIGTRCR